MRFGSRPTLSLVCLGLAAALGCDSSAPRRDAAAQRPGLGEVALRLDAPNGASPSVSVLAFRATVSGVVGVDVLPVVDPLVTDAPDAGCELRNVAGAARTLAAQGGRVDLDALTGLSFDLGPGAPYLRPTPRVYPELGAAVGGVVGEAGPVDVAQAPPALTINDGTGVPQLLPVRTLPRLLREDGAAVGTTVVASPDHDLVLLVAGPARSFVELRPFGATVALACALEPHADGHARLVVPAAELARLARTSGQVPVSIEAVYRESNPVTLAGAQVRVTVEARSSSVVELRP